MKNEILKDIGKFLWKTFIVAIPLYFIHELGHIVVQILVGLPVSLGVVPEIGITTTVGLGIATQPPQIFYPVAIAGLIASLIPIKYLKKFLWFPKGFENTKTIWYLAICFSIATQDIALIILYSLFS